VGRLLVILLSAVVVVELILALGVAAALLWLGSGATIAVGAGMLFVTAVAGLWTLRAVRLRR
jgi:hypothetical protein